MESESSADCLIVFIICVPRLRPASAFNAVVAGSDNPFPAAVAPEEDDDERPFDGEEVEAARAAPFFRLFDSCGEDDESGARFLLNEEEEEGILIGDDCGVEHDDDEEAEEGKISTALNMVPLEVTRDSRMIKTPRP